jgi:ParB-like chromosome segregation protein Spo0J
MNARKEKKARSKPNRDNWANIGAGDGSKSGESMSRAAKEDPTFPLNKLRPHPLQETFNQSCSEQEDAALAADLAERGQRDAIHCMPAGNTAGLAPYTMLDGHRRRTALLANGAKTGKVIIRRDLTHADAAEVEKVFLMFNGNRRHYDWLSVACSLIRQREIDQRRERGKIGGREFKKVVEALAAAMRAKDERNPRRYAHVALAPIEIQNAFRAGHLTLGDAARVGGMDAETQATMAQSIAKKTDRVAIRAIVKKYFHPRLTLRPKYVTPIAIRAIMNMRRELERIGGRFDKLHGPTLKEHEAALTEIKRGVEEPLTAAQRPGADILDPSNPILKEIGALIKKKSFIRCRVL